jgi:hypothetical protein
MVERREKSHVLSIGVDGRRVKWGKPPPRSMVLTPQPGAPVHSAAPSAEPNYSARNIERIPALMQHGLGQKNALGYETKAVGPHGQSPTAPKEKDNPRD